jgi:DNA-binding HxlR family transcriptional regulator
MSRPYDQYCPIARAAEVLGDRWTLLIVRELISGAHGFNEIGRGLPRISRGLLTQRLRQLEELGVLERSARGEGKGTGYTLTAAGEGLRDLIMRLGEWGARWAFGEPHEAELDAQLLLWKISRRADGERYEGRTVVRFDFRDDRAWYWLVLDGSGASLCLKNPGFDVDVRLRTDLRTLYEVWLGRRPLGHAIADGTVHLEGQRRPVQVFRSLLARLSPLAYAVREAQRAAGGAARAGGRPPRAGVRPRAVQAGARPEAKSGAPAPLPGHRPSIVL